VVGDSFLVCTQQNVKIYAEEALKDINYIMISCKRTQYRSHIQYSKTEHTKAQYKELIDATNLFRAQTRLTKPRIFNALQQNDSICLYRKSILYKKIMPKSLTVFLARMQDRSTDFEIKDNRGTRDDKTT